MEGDQVDLGNRKSFKEELFFLVESYKLTSDSTARKVV